MDKLKSHFLTLSLPVKIAVLAVVVIALAVAFSSVAGKVQQRRYETKIQGLEAAAAEAQAKAGAEVERAKAAHIRAEMLEAELAKANQRLLDANADLLEARTLSGQTRTVYVEKKSNPQRPQYLTGNPSIDSVELCARLRSAGFPCQ